ncbi:MAG: DUF1778 domain-containing protein [Pseudomonadota bacterium]|nr:DUF1778 domain-containing protein [Pseudomonadota bacterium]
MPATARIELRVEPESKRLIERAAELSHQSVTAFAIEALVGRARELVEGPASAPSRLPRPIGGWSFELPEGWDAPLDDLAEYR